MSYSVTKSKDAGLTLLIYDTLNDWVNENEKERIPRKAFLEVALDLTDKVIAREKKLADNYKR